MKQILSMLSFITVITLFSCSKEKDHSSKSITIDTTLASGAKYQLDLKSYGDDDDVAAITKQAASFTSSEIVNTGNAFSPVYNFSALADKAILNEQVVIAITEGNRGGNNHHNCDSTLITINFKVQ